MINHAYAIKWNEKSNNPGKLFIDQADERGAASGPTLPALCFFEPFFLN
jgi:hypothetical protein